MAVKYIKWGQKVDLPVSNSISELASACSNHSHCNFIEYRDIKDIGLAVIVDIGDGTFDSANMVGIHRVERLALILKSGIEFSCEVRALREDFPFTSHQNHVATGEPRSLCLYFETWSSVERTWTPQSFLNRICWWLRNAAEGTLHHSNQPLEQLFFNSANCFILPEDYLEKLDNHASQLEFECIKPKDIDYATYLGKYIEKGKKKELLKCIIAPVSLDSFEHGVVEEFPATLGELDQKIRGRGSNMLDSLMSVIKNTVDALNGISLETNSKQLILLVIKATLQRDGVDEKNEIYGFLLETHFGELGQQLNILFRNKQNPKEWFVEHLFSPTEHNSNWKNHQISPVDIKFMPTKKDIRQYSDIKEDEVQLSGVIIGVGALGSSIAEIWARECWGNWSYIDDDIIQPHNLARHIAMQNAVGFSKAEVVKAMTDGLISLKSENSSAAYNNKVTGDLEWMKQSIFPKSNIIVDTSTTLQVPRDLSTLKNTPRVASAFLTPSGLSSVLLLEGEKDGEKIRSLSLEAQYYRAILLSDTWGKEHLSSNQNQFWVGSGCRDISASISNELVKIHAGIIARQLRKATYHSKPNICIWEYHDSNGEVCSHNIPVAKQISVCQPPHK